MPIFPDSGWLNTLKLPAKIFVGLFLFFTILLIFDWYSLVKLSEFGALSRSVIIVFDLFFGCLSFVSLVSFGYEKFVEHRKPRILSQRRKIRDKERMAQQVEYEGVVLKRLEFLSEDELRYLTDCLRKNEQSFLGYVHHGPISNLMAKGLVDTPGGTHNQDHYPFYIRDFAWGELQKRKDEFISKYDMFKQNQN